MIKKLFFLECLFALACNCIPAIAQNTNSNLESESSPSINASGASTGQSIGVDKYTGKLQAGFTIYSYQNQSTGLSHSISISYKGGGIGVDDIASNIGLGFTLNTGGSVSRSINGVPDEGLYNNTGTLAVAGFTTASSVPSTLTGTDLDYYSGYHYDGQYDDFYYSAGAQSGSFHIGKDGSITQVPLSNVKIEQLLNGYSSSSAVCDSCYSISYRITLPDGTKYLYANYNCNALTTTGYGSTTWYLTKIIAPFNKDSICFDYTPVVQSYMAGMVYSSYFIDFSLSSSPVVIDTINIRLRDMRLTDIRYTDGTTVNFNYDPFYRLDVPSDNGLNNITITNGTTSYGYKFNYSYSHNLPGGGADLSSPYAYVDYSGTPPADTNQLDYRLVLNNFNKFSGSDSLPPTTFAYYPSIPVPRGSESHVDKWGFYSSVASTRVPTWYSDFTVSREADTGSQESSLQEVILPTGGNMQFAYENNSYKDTTTDISYTTGATYSTNTVAGAYGIPDGYFYTITSSGPPYDDVELGSSTPPSGDMKNVYFTFTYDGTIWPGSPGSGYSAHLTVYNMQIEVVINWPETVTTSYGFVTFTPTDFGPKSLTISVPAAVGSGAAFNPGLFKFKFHFAGEYGPYWSGPFEPQFDISVDNKSVTEVVTPINHNVGGIRVKALIASDSTGQNNQNVKSYQYNNNDGFSSGVIGDTLIYNYHYKEWDQPSGDYVYYDPIFGTIQLTPYPGTLYFFNTYTSQAENSLSLTHGSSVGYSKVEEYLGTPANYKQMSVCNFTNQFADTIGISALYHNSFPFAPLPNLDFTAGLPLSVYNYNAAGLLLSKVENQYTTYVIQQNDANHTAIQTGILQYPTNNDTSNFIYQKYYPVTGKVFPSSTKQTSYYAGNDSLVNTTQFVYDTAKMVLRQQSTTDSRGVPVATKYYYPYDFSMSGAIAQLQDSGMIYFPIRTEVWKGTSAPYLVSSSVSTFQQLSDGSVRPQSAFGLAINSAVNSSTWGVFDNTQLLQNASLFTMMGSMDRYDSKGNLVQVTSKGHTSATIWGYNKEFPTASVTNASFSDIAYTSFEGNDYDFGNWVASGTVSLVTGGITGTTAALLGGAGGSLAKNGLDPSKTYVISLWIYSGGPIPTIIIDGSSSVTLTPSDTHNSWTLNKATFSGSTSVTVTGGLGILIDELRLYPLGAAMTTSTYTPLVGVTSKCDASNRTVYYEYDDFGRLKDLRDMDKNVIKKYDYAMQAPQY